MSRFLTVFNAVFEGHKVLTGLEKACQKTLNCNASQHQPVLEGPDARGALDPKLR